jgi:hypothetical protein
MDRSGAVGRGELAAAYFAEIVGLYGLRMWAEQSYKQSNTSWAGATTRSRVTRRSAVAGSLCAAHFRSVGGPTVACRSTSRPERRKILAPIRREGEKVAPSILAGGIEDGKGVVGAV